jgi:glycine oxidase
MQICAKESDLASYDLTVRGAGIFGLSVAWVAAARGAKVQVIDPNGPAASSSGGIVGALAPHVPEKWNAKKAFQLDSLLMAETFWAHVETAGGGASGYARRGRLQPIADEHALELAHARCASAQDLWQDNAVWEVVAATDADWEPTSPSGWLIRDTLSALVHPRQGCEALVKALETKGVHVVTDAPDAGTVLWATGVAGLEAMTADHHRSIGNGVKGQAALLDYDARGMPQLFAGGVHIIPHSDGTVAIGSTSEREYATGDQTDEQLDTVIAAACAAVPALAAAKVIDRWAGLRPRARSRAPMLGAWPDRSGHFIANGGFKIGFGMAPKIAHVMTDLMLDGVDTVPDGFKVEDNL